MPQRTTTHYAVLGISPRASREEVRRAFRSRAALVHPDRNDADDAVDRFIALSRAHETLLDPRRRRAYDRQLAAKRRQRPGVSQARRRARRAGRRMQGWGWGVADGCEARMRALRRRRRRLVRRMNRLTSGMPRTPWLRGLTPRTPWLRGLTPRTPWLRGLSVLVPVLVVLLIALPGLVGR